MIKKASRKVNVLSGVAPCMNVAKRKLQMKFIFCIKYVIIVVWTTKSFSWQNVYEFFIVTVGHHLKICWIRREVSQCMSKICSPSEMRFPLETFKISKNLSGPIVKFFLKKVITLTYENHQNFLRPRVLSVFHGQENVSQLGPKKWDMIFAEMKNLTTACAFKREVKKWKPASCSCRLCICCIHSVGFVWNIFQVCFLNI